MVNVKTRVPTGILWLCISLGLCFTGELYVSDKCGSDQDGDGTEQKPFKTPLKVNMSCSLKYHCCLTDPGMCCLKCFMLRYLVLVVEVSAWILLISSPLVIPVAPICLSASHCVYEQILTGSAVRWEGAVPDPLRRFSDAGRGWFKKIFFSVF